MGLSDREAIAALLVRYCHLCDDGDFDAFAELFDETATFTVMGHTYEGRQQIKDFMAAAQPPEARGKHLISQPLIELDPSDENDGETTARAATDYAFIGRTVDGLAVTSSGRYLDRFVRRDASWRFASREIVFMGG